MKKKIVINHNTNKQLRHYDKDGDFIRLSVDETIARGLNAWQGWSCSAGVKNLYIDFDGNVWICNTASAVTDRFNLELFRAGIDNINHNKQLEAELWEASYAKYRTEFFKSDASVRKIFEKDSHAGLLGNIFDGFDLPKEWFSCKWQLCGCGADVFIPKHVVGYDHFLVNGADHKQTNLVDDIETPVAVEPNFSIPHQILWDLGRRCNYDCSYCWPSVHNKDAPHKSLEVMKSAADKVFTEWDNREIRWNFGGGEPTLNPNFLAFLEYLKEKKQWILVTTNGSRPRSYWKQAIQYINSVNLSVHFEYVNENKLMGNIEEICNHFDNHDDDHWLEIKLMAPPKYIQRAVDLKQRIISETTLPNPGANKRIKGTMSIVPIRGMDGVTLLDYSPEELKLIQEQ